MQMPTSGSAADRKVLDTVDARTALAGSNKMELLLFKVGSPETYGINVFKVKEVIRNTVLIAQAPSQPEFVVGMTSIRGQLVPVVDLIRLCGNSLADAPAIMIVTEFSHSTQAFLVESVDTIVRVDWSEVHQPPAMLSATSKVIGVTQLADGRLTSILDVEQILHTIKGTSATPALPYAFTQAPPMAADISIFFADDSAFARKQLQQILEGIGVKSDCAVNGREAWARLDALASSAAAAGRRLADTVPMIISDIEMPEMDGFMLVRMLKADRRFEGIKVLLHSSMSESSNRDKGLAMGADGFLSKYNPVEVAETLGAMLTEMNSPVSGGQSPAPRTAAGKGA